MDPSDRWIARYAKCAGLAQEFELRVRLFYEARLNQEAPERLQDVIDGAPFLDEQKESFHRARLLRNKLDHGEFWTAETRAEAFSGRAPRKVDVEVYDACGIPVTQVIGGSAPSLGSHRDLVEKLIFPWLLSSAQEGGLFDEVEEIFEEVIHDLKTT